jgi:polyferredoxin
MNWHVWIVMIIVGFGIAGAIPRYLLTRQWPPREPTPQRELVGLLVNVIFGAGAVVFFLTMGIDTLTVICSTGCSTAFLAAALLSWERYKWRKDALQGRPERPFPTIRTYRKT